MPYPFAPGMTLPEFVDKVCADHGANKFTTTSARECLVSESGEWSVPIPDVDPAEVLMWNTVRYLCRRLHIPFDNLFG